MVKPTVLFILLISVIGYIYCTRCHFTSPKFSKSNGYHTFLNAASTGGGIFLFATFVYWLFSLISPDIENFYIGFLTYFLTDIFRDLAPSLTVSFWSLNFIQISIIAIALSFLLPALYMIIAILLTFKGANSVKHGSFKKISETDDSPEFSSIYFKSCETGLPIAFTLSNRKVYIGYAITGAKHLNDIMILPLKSGYRCTEELRLELITDYQGVLEYIFKNDEDELVNRFLIAIPVREIVHASLHDLGYRDLFSEHEVPKKEKGLLKRIGLI